MQIILGLGLISVAGILVYIATRPRVLTEEERRSLALSIVRSYRIPDVEETVNETAEKYEMEGFSITWHVEYISGDWYRVWFTGVSADGRKCSSAYFNVNISTGEVEIERVAELGSY